MSQKFSLGARVSTAAAVAAAFVGMLVAGSIAYAQVPTLSQTSVTVGVGQSTTITSENGIDVYMDSNSASNVVSSAVNGTQITITGVTPGTATLSLCQVGTTSDCTNAGVTVQTGNVSALSFSQNNISLAIGGNQSISVSGGNGAYSVSSNSNSGDVSASLSGSTLTVSGIAIGSATIDVCDTTGSVCGTVSVTVNNTSGTSSLSFSQNNISLAPGSDQTVTISGGNGEYNITGNSSPSVVSVGLSNGTSLVVDPITGGGATIIVCDTSNPNICGTLSVAVTGSTTTTTGATTAANGSGPVIFSTTNPTVAVGQTTNVTISGSAISYFISSNQSSNIAEATMNGETELSLSGESAGTDSVTVCATGGAGCSQLSVSVTGGSASTATPATTTVVPTTTIAATPMTVVTTQPTQPGTAVANTALLSEIQSLQSAVTQALTQIESIQTQLSQLEAQVSAGSGSGISTNISASTFTELLAVGSENAQVSALQQQLTSLGFYSGPITGYYGTLTEQAVIKYQTAHGIEATGSLGPSTRAALNAGN